MGCKSDGRLQKDREWQRREPLMQGHPPVDAAGNRDGSDVVAKRHVGTAFGAQGCGVGAGARSSGRVECEHLAITVHECIQVATHPAQVRCGDGDRGARGNRRVYGVAAEDQGAHPCLCGQLIRAGDHSLGGADGVETG